MQVTFIILFIDVTFGLLFDDFSIHVHSFISKQSLYKTDSSFI